MRAVTHSVITDSSLRSGCSTDHISTALNTYELLLPVDQTVSTLRRLKGYCYKLVVLAF